MMSMKYFDLSGKVAVITGSTKGIGLGIAEALAEAGSNVVVISRNRSDCLDTAAMITQKYGVEALGYSLDINSHTELDDLVKAVTEKYGRIHILVNNAGVALTKKAEDLTEDDWDYVLNTNQKAAFFISKAVGRHMMAYKQGKIINVSSIFGIVGGKQILPYSVSKGGLNQMTRSLALEWARYNIQVNALCPGYILTALNKNELNHEKVSNFIIGNTPLRRLGEVGDIKGAAIFLASAASDFLTGQTLCVDGGWTAQ